MNEVTPLKIDGKKCQLDCRQGAKVIVAVQGTKGTKGTIGQGQGQGQGKGQ